MASDTFSNYVLRMRRYLHEYNNATSFWKDPVLKQLFNMTYRRYCVDLIMAYEGYFTNVVTTPIIANQSYYTWPDGFERLIKLEIQRLDGRTVPLKRQERHESANIVPVSGGESYYPSYRPTGGGFFLEPACRDGATATTVLIDFDTPDSSIIAHNADSSWSASTGNYKQGSGALLIEKIGVATSAFGFIQDLNADLSTYTTGKLWVYIPTLTSGTTNYIGTFHLDLGDTSLGNYNRWTFSAGTTFEQGWNELEIDFTNATTVVGTGWTDTSVPQFRMIFNTSGAAIKPGGVLVDSFEVPYATLPSDVNYLRTEYVGTPTLLVSDDDLLHPDFPITFEELIVVSAVVAAMRAESMLENGPPRALVEQLNSMEDQWLRYIDNRIIAKQRIQPAVGWYEDS